MYDVKPFVPKIRVEFTDRVEIYNSIKDFNNNCEIPYRHDNFWWLNNHPSFTDKQPYVKCTNCNIVHNKKSNFSKKCFQEVKIRCYEKNTYENRPLWTPYSYKTIIVENKKGHNLIDVVRLSNELGDLFPPPEPKKYHYKKRITSYEDWLTSEISPNLRGILPIERERVRNKKHGNSWEYKYRHAIARRPINSYYRQVKTFNEHKQYYASMVDEYAPIVRGKRKPATIPCHWDDRYPHYDKSWKNKKIQKQWMINHPKLQTKKDTTYDIQNKANETAGSPSTCESLYL
jgi:hypothetical protein